MIKELSLSLLLVFSSYKAPLLRKKQVVNEDLIYSQDFESYNGDSADRYAYFNIGMVCDAASKSVINSIENIDGYSFKAGGIGYCYSNGLLCFQANTIPFKNIGEGYYTTTFDVRIVNASNFGFSYLESMTDVYLGGISFDLDDVNGTVDTPTDNYSVTNDNGVYHVSFDFYYQTCESWGYFFATFDQGGGYIVVDNFKVRKSSNEQDVEEIEIVKTSIYDENFDGLEANNSAELWNKTQLFWFNDEFVDIKIAERNGKKGLEYTIKKESEYIIFGGIGSGAINNLENLHNGQHYMLSMYVDIITSQSNPTFYVEPQFNEWTGVKILNDVCTVQNAATTSSPKYENKVLSFEFTAYGEGNEAYVKLVAQNLKIGDVVFVDDFEIYQNKIVSADDKYKYIQRFEDYKNGDVPSYLWNSLHWCSDAGIAEFIKGDEAIKKQSLKVGNNVAGYYHDNLVLCSRSTMNPFDTGKGYYTIEFDVKFVNINQFGYYLKEENTNGVIAKIVFDVDNMEDAVCTNPNYLIEQVGNYYHISLDVETENSNNWQEFTLDIADGGGYMVIDNISIKESDNEETERTLIFKDKFENYDGNQTINDYLWYNTHLYSDSTNLSIEDGFSNKALVSNTRKGSYQASSYIGLQGGNGPGSLNVFKDSIYEISFDISCVNITSYTFDLKYLNPDKGDIDFAKIIIDLEKENYSCNVAAKVDFNDNYIHVYLQFKAPMSTVMFGFFGYSCDDNGKVLFDNYTLTKIKNFSIPFVDTGFEGANLYPFGIETNKTKEEKLLARITNNEDYIINGKYSALCGFDASKISEDSNKWATLLRLVRSFDKDHNYCVQFRFNIIIPSEHFYYIEMGGQDGLYLRFNGNGIVDKSSNVEGNILQEGNHLVLQAKFNVETDLDNLIIATYGGGFIVVDDITINQGSIYQNLPEIVKDTPSGTKIFTEGFENQKSGSYLDFHNFISGVDVFDTVYGYNQDAINGKVSCVIRSGSYWAEQISTKNKLLQDSTIYTLAFRYKPLELANGNISIIVRGDDEKYIALSLDGKVTGFTYGGGLFYKNIDLAYITAKDGYYEAYVTFITPTGNPKLIIGTYGVCEIAIDDFTLYQGDLARFDTEDAVMVSSANRDDLYLAIKNIEQLNLNEYTEESRNDLTVKLNSAKTNYNNLDVSQAEIDNSLAQLLEAKNNLVYVVEHDFIALIDNIANKNIKDSYNDLVNVLKLYNQLKDKEKYSERYQILVNKINEYNDYIDNFNNNFSFSRKQIVASAMLTLLAFILIRIKRSLL